MSMDPLPTLPPSRLPLQKMCDAVDFFDPRTDAIIRSRLQLQPRLHARLWEFARGYDLLSTSGALRPDSRGISFGSGREVLLFAVARECDHLTVTDVYEPDTIWKEARATDPLAFVLAGAPFIVDRARLDVRNMDARRIDYPDAHFDFAYSISAFEHFGDDTDFMAHLSEVRRVLKPEGVYVLTTEIALGAATVASRGNYAFSLEHLLRLFCTAGLSPANAVSMEVNHCGPNEPREDPLALNYGEAGIWEEAILLRDLAGGLSTAVCFALRPATPPVTPPTVHGLASTIAWAEERLAMKVAHRHRDWIRLNPFALPPKAHMLDLHSDSEKAKADGTLAFSTHYISFGVAIVEWCVTVATSVELTSGGDLAVSVNELRRLEATIQAVHSEQKEIPHGVGHVIRARFRIEAREGCAYSVVGIKATGQLAMASVDVMYKVVA